MTDHGREWRYQKAQAKYEVHQTLQEYNEAVRVAVLAELTDEYVQKGAENVFVREYEENSD